MLKPYRPIFLLTATILLHAGASAVAIAQSNGGIAAQVGKVEIDADSSTAGQGVIYYTNAHLRSASGATIDADELRANLAKSSNSLSTVVATGHVRAHINQLATGRSYTVTSDKAVYNPKTNIIDLTGNVKTSVTSAYTVGPLVQTGDSATIQLGTGPDYPIIKTNHVHVIFTPQQ